MKTKIQNLEMVEVPELGIRITPKQYFNGKLYEEEILEEVEESQIPSYETLQKLRNIAYESNWEKYPFMKNFWVFVPNPDKASKEHGYVAWLYAYSDRANLSSDWNPFIRNSGAGVFLYEKLDDKARVE